MFGCVRVMGLAFVCFFSLGASVLSSGRAKGGFRPSTPSSSFFFSLLPPSKTGSHLASRVHPKKNNQTRNLLDSAHTS